MAEQTRGFEQRSASPSGQAGWRARLERQVALSRLALGFERLWPALWWPISVALLFLTVSALGLWDPLPPGWRMAGVGAFAALLLASLSPLMLWRWPGRRAGIDRLDASARGAHRPAAALDDQLALGGADQTAQALWRLHLERQRAALDQLAIAAPQPRMAERDRRALRFAPLVAAIGAFFVAGPELPGRIAAAFAWREAPPSAPSLRVDAWIDPPAYTRLPPVLVDIARQAGEALRAPSGSVVIVRIAGDPARAGGGGIEARGRFEPVETPRTGDGAQESRFRLLGEGSLVIRPEKGREVALAFSAIPDVAPEISFVDTPAANDRGGLVVAYRARDDYGVTAVEGQFEPIGARLGARPLIEPPRVTLALPASPSGEEEVKTTLDLGEHPWAGARVRMTLIARDEAGQVGRSDARDVTLPQRTFTNPLAKALVEERRRLILDMDQRRHVQTALDALLIAPETFMPEKGNYLGLRMIADELRRSRTQPQLVGVAESLWAMALHLENDGLSDAERDLRAAQERLQQALERGASNEEIKRLTDEMRRAMDRFMRDLAERMERQSRENGREMSRLPENFRTVTPRDLKSLLDRIEELARRGETAEAQRLLEQLREMMKNLQMARPNQRNQLGQQRNEAMNELDQLTREQQQLRDETFRQGEQRRSRQARPQRRPGDQQQTGPGERQQRGQQGQRQRGQQQPGDGGEEGDEDQQMGEGQEGGEPGQGLQQRQQALRDRLKQLQQKMQGLGMEGEDTLGEAEGSMGEAEGALGQQGGEGQATDAQGRAIDALRRGTQNLARQMQRGDGEGDGTENAMGDDPNPTGRARADSRAGSGERDDPLGRPQRSRDWKDGNVKVPGADESASQRARRVLEELRRRLSEAGRPQDEIDYFERLLRRN